MQDRDRGTSLGWQEHILEGGSLGQVKLVDEMELGGWRGEGDGVLLIT